MQTKMRVKGARLRLSSSTTLSKYAHTHAANHQANFGPHNHVPPCLVAACLPRRPSTRRPPLGCRGRSRWQHTCTLRHKRSRVSSPCCHSKTSCHSKMFASCRAVKVTGSFRTQHFRFRRRHICQNTPTKKVYTRDLQMRRRHCHRDSLHTHTCHSAARVGGRWGARKAKRQQVGVRIKNKREGRREGVAKGSCVNC